MSKSSSSSTSSASSSSTQDDYGFVIARWSFFKIYFVLFEVVENIWVQMNASYMDFPKVLEKAFEEVENTIKTLSHRYMLDRYLLDTLNLDINKMYPPITFQIWLIDDCLLFPYDDDQLIAPFLSKICRDRHLVDHILFDSNLNHIELNNDTINHITMNYFPSKYVFYFPKGFIPAIGGLFPKSNTTTSSSSISSTLSPYSSSSGTPNPSPTASPISEKKVKQKKRHSLSIPPTHRGIPTTSTTTAATSGSKTNRARTKSTHLSTNPMSSKSSSPSSSPNNSPTMKLAPSSPRSLQSSPSPSASSIISHQVASSSYDKVSRSAPSTPELSHKEHPTSKHFKKRSSSKSSSTPSLSKESKHPPTTTTTTTVSSPKLITTIPSSEDIGEVPTGTRSRKSSKSKEGFVDQKNTESIKINTKRKSSKTVKSKSHQRQTTISGSLSIVSPTADIPELPTSPSTSTPNHKESTNITPRELYIKNISTSVVHPSFLVPPPNELPPPPPPDV
eukprot:TRINITY_DN1659_c2_g3_i2.p1 TRINITY_DN1659_c2_g3~~TRINITY_DN1659_c2_g3_i2.p1  ORF type:complete len:504 (+),score=112.52 TRINITY_DN1659_c2_g3_i2:134-1645(+)